MTSVDSGVETGNDSNDSYAPLDSQSTAHEVSPVKISTNFVYTATQSATNNSGMSKSPSPTKPIKVLVKTKINDEFSRFRAPCQKKSMPEEQVESASSIEPPAGISFCNLQHFCLGNSYEVIGELGPIYSREKQRKLRVLHCRLKNRNQSAWYHIKGPEERRLRQAASTNNVDLVKTILDAGVNPNTSDDQGRTPLHMAACRGYCEIVRLLLEKGANPNRRDSLGNTPLHLAACTNNVGVVTMLLNAGTDVRSIDYYGRSPLQLAQSKLKLLQRGVSNEDSNLVKQEVRQVIEMMLAYLQKRGQEIEAELLGAFSSRLTLSNTREEVETGVRDLLASLSNLSLEKSENDQAKPTDKE